MGQHLGHQKESNALRKHLERRGVCPEKCIEFQMIAHGPLFPQSADMKTHRPPRDTVAALEKALADALGTSGYQVLNTVRCRKPLDGTLWALVRDAFAAHFPRLARHS